jgi:cytochrome b involved in lipid metabolism
MSVNMKTFTLEEVAKHNTEKDCWVVVNNDVIDVTKFLSRHPGGKKVILFWAGKDASETFNKFHYMDTVIKFTPELIIGKLYKD